MSRNKRPVMNESAKTADLQFLATQIDAMPEVQRAFLAGAIAFASAQHNSQADERNK